MLIPELWGHRINMTHFIAAAVFGTQFFILALVQAAAPGCQSALCFACQRGEHSVVEVLLGTGVNRNLLTDENSTLLQEAAFLGHIDTVEGHRQAPNPHKNRLEGSASLSNSMHAKAW